MQDLQEFAGESASSISSPHCHNLYFIAQISTNQNLDFLIVLVGEPFELWVLRQPS